MLVAAAVTDGSGNAYAVGYVADTTAGVSRLAVRRYSATGQPDLDYGDQNGVALPLPASVIQNAAGAALDAEGRLLVVGTDTWEEVVPGKGKKTSTRQVEAAVVVRLLSTGELDTDFGDNNDGVVRLELDQAIRTTGHDVTVLSGGEVLVTGSALTTTTTSGGGGKGKKSGGTTTTSPALLLVQLTASGSYDTSFGDEGVVIEDRSTGTDYISLRGVAVQSDGSIVVGGVSREAGDVFVRRYDADGDLDSTFATSGEILLKTGSTWGGVSVAVDSSASSDRIIAAYTLEDATGGSADLVVMRLDVDGVVDDTFGTSGEFQSALSADDDLIAVAVGSNGSVFATGSVFASGVRGVQLLRLTSSGALDSTFGTGGYADSLLPLPSGQHQVRSLVVGANGDPVLAGEYWPLTSGGSLPPGWLARYCGS